MKKLAYINVLRGIAILLVLIVHTSQQGIGVNKMPHLLVSLINQGPRGVQLFYMLSAFTLFRSYHIRSQSEARPINNFFIRRAFRIAPLYYLAIIYYILQGVFVPVKMLSYTPVITNGSVIANFAFIHALSPYWIMSIVPGGWSVGIEVLFYIFLPLLFISIKNTKQAFNFLVISLLFRSLFIFLFTQHPLIKDIELWNDFLFFSLPNQLYVFALGILMYFLIADDFKIAVSKLAVFVFVVLLSLKWIFDTEIILPHILPVILLLFIFSISLSRYSTKLLINNFFIYLGKISYSVYLIHFSIFYWLTKLNFIDFIHVTNGSTALFNFLLRLCLTIILTMAIGTFTYNFVERPFIKFAERIIKSGINNSFKPLP